MPHPALMILAEEAGYNASRAAGALGRLPDGISVAGVIADFATVGDFDHYRHVPDPVRSALAQVEALGGRDALRLFLRAVLGQGLPS